MARATLAGAVFAAIALACASPAAAADGSFASSDRLLNRIWSASVATAERMVAPGPLTTDTLDRPCAIALAVVILDGSARDRCPYIGDQAVTGKTLLVAGGHAAALRETVRWFAQHQRADGVIPASPYDGAALVLFDYNAYWLESLYDYVLATGDLAFARAVWPQVVRLIDGWYGARVGPRGLLVNDVGAGDYAYVPRRGTTIAYFNAGYVRALRLAVRIAGWLRDTEYAGAWRARTAPVAAAFPAAFWDAKAGSFRDTPTGRLVHPQDGNVLAILAGLASRAQARAALRHLSRNARPYGNPFADTNVWNQNGWGYYARDRVYPFIGYFELAARYQTGLDRSALELVRREWGYMLTHGPRGHGMWESIGPGEKTAGEIAGYPPSYDHGWSSGAAPILTEYVLGVRATSPGFARVAVEPRPSGLAWARGAVPTPRGTIQVEWSRRGRTLTLKVTAPAPATLTLPAVGRATLDGKAVSSGRQRTTVRVGRGTHTLTVTTSR